MFWNLATYLMLVVSFFYLFVCVDINGTGILGGMKRFLFIKLPDGLRWLGRKTLGDVFVKMVEAFAHYLCYKANPLVQIIYVACAGGGFYIYVLVGFPLIPSPYISEWNKTLGIFLMMWCYISYALACWVDPGHTTK